MLVYYQILDKRTNEVVKVFVDDTVLLRFADGSTVEAEFLGPEGGTTQFRVLLETAQDANGDPLFGSVGGSPSGVGNSISIDEYMQLAEIDVTLRFDCAINTRIESCDVYGPGTCSVALRSVSVPCPW